MRRLMSPEPEARTRSKQNHVLRERRVTAFGTTLTCCRYWSLSRVLTSLSWVLTWDGAVSGCAADGFGSRRFGARRAPAWLQRRRCG